MKEYYIDQGSSTIKVYEYENELLLLEEHSIYLKNGFTEEVKRHTFTLPTLSSKELSRIINSLEEMTNVINNRVVELN